MPSDVSPPIPDRIGPYKIDRILGTGGMGAVYHGVHDDTGEEAAVKVLPAQMASQDGFVARFNREIVALEKVSNPRIVSLKDHGVDGETYYYAMEYVPGETLTDLLHREERLPWRTVIDYGVQICTALKAAHDAGVIHRDLKPGNLLVTEDGTVKLADFGVAQVFAESKLTATGGVVGTAEYMSPEQARGVRVTKKSDIYSLGAVLYVMVTGRPPFSGASAVDILHKHQYGQFERPGRLVAGVPSWLDDLICLLMEKDPEKRPPDAHVVSRRLQEIVKKVELSQGQETRAPSVESVSVADEQIIAGDVGPTLMRDLVRSEIERVNASGNGLLDNIWVLVALLGLIILGGIWWFQWRTPDPQDLFDKGVALMEEEDGSSWLIAEDEYFNKLLEIDRATWEPQISSYMDKIADFKKRRDQQPSGKRVDIPVSLDDTEPERLLRLAKFYRDNGDLVRAINTTTALITLVREDPEQSTVFNQAAQLLVNLQTDTGARVREFINGQLKRADELEASGKSSEAQEVRSSLETLYGNNPAYRNLIESKEGSNDE